MEAKCKRSFLNGHETLPFRERPSPNAKLIWESASEESLLQYQCREHTKSSHTSSDSQGTSSAACVSGIPETANVYLRIRPVELDSIVWKFRIEQSDTFVAANIESGQTKNKNTVEQHYKFNHVFDGFTTQMDIYNICVKPFISLDDSATIMVYGTSGSGKTHTLLGDSSNPGLVPRALSQLFVEYGNNISNHPICKIQNGVPAVIHDDQIYQEKRNTFQLLKSMTDSPGFMEMLEKLKVENNFNAKVIEKCDIFLWISFVEIYNEEIYDLLEPQGNNLLTSNICVRRTNLKVISNRGHPFIKGAAKIFVRTFEDIIKILQYGMNNVSTGSTVINERSSRSHCMFFVDVIKWNGLTISSTTYKFCDLAGSERLKKTENIGKRLKEAQNINKSLMTLGRCLTMANERQKNKSIRIPYRDSKLTTLLQNALLGHEKISLIVNINPKMDYIEENLNVLSFASIAKKIITKPKDISSRLVHRISRYSLFVSTMLSPSVSTPTESSIDFKQQTDDLLDIHFKLETKISWLKHQLVQKEISLRKSIVEALDQEYQNRVKEYELKIAKLKIIYKARTEQLEKCLKQKKRVLRQKDHTINKLKTRINQLNQDEIVYVTGGSDTDESNSVFNEDKKFKIS